MEFQSEMKLKRQIGLFDRKVTFWCPFANGIPYPSLPPHGYTLNIYNID